MAEGKEYEEKPGGFPSRAPTARAVGTPVVRRPRGKPRGKRRCSLSLERKWLR